MDYESVAALCEAFNEYFRTLVEAIREVSEKIGEILEEIRDTILKAENKPKSQTKHPNTRASQHSSAFTFSRSRVPAFSRPSVLARNRPFPRVGKSAICHDLTGTGRKEKGTKKRIEDEKVVSS